MSAALDALARTAPRGTLAFHFATWQGRPLNTSTGETVPVWPGWTNRVLQYRAVGPSTAILWSISTAPLNKAVLAAGSSYAVVGFGNCNQFSTSSATTANTLTLTAAASDSNQTLEGNWNCPVYQSLAIQAVSSASTVEEVLSTPMDALVAELEELRELPVGWDGEGAAPPISDAINDAISFVRSIGDIASRLEPAPDVDGSILLEIDDGGTGSLRFRGDHTIIYAIRGVAPGIVGFDGRIVPGKISEAFDAAL
jgi:hypothetical protein